MLLLAACGGGGSGGGGATVQISGTIFYLSTGAPPDPAATVQVGSRTTQTASDGSFTIAAESGTTSLLVINPAPSITFRFDFDAVNANTDLGELWIGPEAVNVTGRVIDAGSSAPINGAVVKLGGKQGTSGSDGRFSIAGVAYDSGNLPAFFALPGRIAKPGFLARDFFPGVEAAGGTADLGDFSLTPEGSSVPPPVPFNIEGFVSPPGEALGTVVTLKKDGTPVRQFTVGSDNRYSFFVGAGAYVASYQNPTNGKSAPDESIVLNSANQVIRKDVTLR